MKFWNTDLLESPRNGDFFYTYHPYIPQLAKAAILKTRNIDGSLELIPEIDGYKKENYKIYAWANSDIDPKSTEVINELDEVHNKLGKKLFDETKKLLIHISSIGEK